MLPSHTTRSPGSRPVTPSPTESITPLHSWPGTTGKRTQRGFEDARDDVEVVRQTPAWMLRTRTSAKLGDGASISRSEDGVGLLSITMARMGFGVEPSDSQTGEWSR